MAPVADFAEVMQQAPGTFSLNPNGIGLGQGKSFFRGFSDGQYTMTFDGIPFEDTNSSDAPFLGQLSLAVDQFDGFRPQPRPGLGLRPHQLRRIHQSEVSGTAGRPRYSRHVLVRLVQHEAVLARSRFRAALAQASKDAVLININAMTSDGYQTFNNQKRDAGYGKYQYRFSDRTSLTSVRRRGGYLEQHAEHHESDTRAGCAVRR